MIWDWHSQCLQKQLGVLGYPMGIILDNGQALTSDDLSNLFRSSQPIYSLADKIQGGLRGQSWLQDKGKYIRFAPSQQKAVAWSDFLSCNFEF